jgi:hypothetical protein
MVIKSQQTVMDSSDTVITGSIRYSIHPQHYSKGPGGRQALFLGAAKAWQGFAAVL